MSVEQEETIAETPQGDQGNENPELQIVEEEEDLLPELDLPELNDQEEFDAACYTDNPPASFVGSGDQRIVVYSVPVANCPHCVADGHPNSDWLPHKFHSGAAVRYVCTRFADDLTHSHHLDIPLCPTCQHALYVYHLNQILGSPSSLKNHKYALKCHGKHVLPILDLVCTAADKNQECGGVYKLEWTGQTMVVRCSNKKSRDHDLWWIRYKNEWKQRRTFIRYKSEFLSRLTAGQLSQILGLAVENEPSPTPHLVLGQTFRQIMKEVVTRKTADRKARNAMKPKNPLKTKRPKTSFLRTPDSLFNNQLLPLPPFPMPTMTYSQFPFPYPTVSEQPVPQGWYTASHPPVTSQAPRICEEELIELHARFAPPFFADQPAGEGDGAAENMPCDESTQEGPTEIQEDQGYVEQSTAIQEVVEGGEEEQVVQE